MDRSAERKQQVDAAVRRTVGIAALRRLRGMADADAAATARRQRLGRILLTAILAITALIAALLYFSKSGG